MPEATIQVNGEARPWRAGLDIAALLAERGVAPEAVATALNGDFVPRDARERTTLRSGDQLMLFTAIVGG